MKVDWVREPQTREKLNMFPMSSAISTKEEPCDAIKENLEKGEFGEELWRFY